ncbi:MAG: hypothetical protein PWP64_762 [Candidatus Cloacimonadota bacterium]|nr:hypothetical protein [Candidatus Cloacimonadota bacterium]
MSNSQLRITLALLVFVFIAVFPLWAQFSGGLGTEESPYLIASAADLDQVRQYPAASFIQTADIDLDLAPFNSGGGWQAIGTWDLPFTGSYDGAGFAISALYIAQNQADYQGLFGYISNASLKSITLLNAQVTGQDYVGAVAGCAEQSQIYDCRIEATVNGISNTGGLIGSLELNSTLNQCRADASVSGLFASGGLCGYVKGNAVVSSCLSTGAVSGNVAAGGAVGILGGAELSQSYSTAAVIADSSVGGLVGENDTFGTIAECYSIGSVDGASFTGGLLGRNILGSTSSSYWNIESSGQDSSAGGEGRNTQDLTYPFSADSFVDWDFAETWNWDAEYNELYPYLSWEYTFVGIDDLALISLQGPGYLGVGLPALYELEIENLGNQSAQGYAIQLFDQEANLLASAFPEPIQSGETMTLSLVWTPLTSYEGSIYAAIAYAADSNLDNNQSEQIEVQVFAEYFEASIGAGDQTDRLPLDFFWKYSISESIFKAQELSFNGLIFNLEFYNDFSEDLLAMPTKVWLGETARDSLSAGWIPASDMQLVFDGLVDYPQGQNPISIDLDTPFSYQSGNLVMLVERPLDNLYYDSTNYFLCQSSPTSCSRSYHSDTEPLNPQTLSTEGSWIALFPRTTFRFMGQCYCYPPTGLVWQYHHDEGWLELSWQAPTQGNPLSYNIYRNEELYAQSSEAFFEDHELAPGQSYSYYVTAVYASGESEPSNVVEAQIPQAAMIAVEPLSIDHSLPVDETDELQLSISNTGGSILEYSSTIIDLNERIMRNSESRPQVSAEIISAARYSAEQRHERRPQHQSRPLPAPASSESSSNRERELMLALDPDYGLVPPDSTLYCLLSIDSYGSLSGTYEYQIVISSNAVNEPELIIPVSITVTGTPAYIPDDNFRRAINDALGQPADYQPTVQDLESLYGDLYADSYNIISIEGAQYLSNLQYLHLYNNQISDLSPLSTLDNLQHLYLGVNQISDLSPLSTLSNLQVLYLYENQISDLSPLSTLSNLQELDLWFNQISDLNPLSTLSNLQELGLSDNQISDLSPLSTLSNLYWLDLGYNQISDLSPLSTLSNLQYLELVSNQISDLSPLSNLSNLQELWLKYNQISDLSPLSTLSNLQYLYLHNNQISDLSPLSTLSNLQDLWLGYNQISDLSPLSTLSNLDYLYLYNNPLSYESMLLTQSWGLPYTTNSYEPLAPCYPDPERAAVDVAPNAGLSWQANYGSEVANYEVYLGSAPDELYYAGMGYQEEDALYSFDITLEPYSEYFWRIKASSGDTEIWSGMWSFTTGEYSEFAGGSGSEADPYQVATAEHLNNVRNYLDAHFIQIADIDLGLSAWNEGEGWLPIGSDALRFSGEYDGDSYSISQMSISRGSESALGLFGVLDGATISNLTVNSSAVYGINWCGIIIGRAYNSSIVNCHAEGWVEAEGGSIGGLIGRMDSSQISNCAAMATVSGGSFVGGLVGSTLYNSTIQSSFSSGSASATGDYVGGLTGSAANTISIQSCYSHSTVSGDSFVGGLIGETDGAALTACYSTGAVEGNSHTGGLVGFNTADSSAEDCYWDTQTSGMQSSVFGMGRSSAEMTYPYALNTYDNWDFNGTWAADLEHELNGGYPYLQWYAPAPDYYPPRFVQAEEENQELHLMWQAPLAGQPDSYQIYRLSPGQETDEASWTLVEAAVMDTMFFDPGWEALPEGTYKWAVKARYGTQLSIAAFSNELSQAAQQAPIVSNVHAAQRDDDSMQVDIFYDVYDADGDALTISMEVSADDGMTWDLSCEEILPGSDIGAGILSGTEKHIVWDAAVEHPNLLYGNNFRFRITADDGVGNIPENFVFVEGGTFNPTDSYGNPTDYFVTLSSFYIDKYEVTQAGYEAVMGTNPSHFSGHPNRPVEWVTWFNAIEYCNRRSTMEGLTPCYSYSSYGTDPDDWPAGWNSNSSNHTNVSCNWSANGYRLPTEMEWMFAAKGGNQSQSYYYSGSNTIGEVAWYRSNAGYELPGGLSHPDFGTHDVGEKAPNELGTFDMSGNVYEWVWDISGSYPSGSQTNPTGADSGSDRVIRGGGWDYYADVCTVSFRFDISAAGTNGGIGFRCLRVSP